MDQPKTSKSWTPAEVQKFRTSIRNDRLFACWLPICYWLRRSEVLGIRWSAIEGDTLSIHRSRVAVGKETIEGLPKSRRSVRELPLPAELAGAPEYLKKRLARRSQSLRNYVVGRPSGRGTRGWLPDSARVVLRRIPTTTRTRRPAPHPPQGSSQHQREPDAGRRFAGACRGRLARP